VLHQLTSQQNQERVNLDRVLSNSWLLVTLLLVMRHEFIEGELEGKLQTLNGLANMKGQKQSSEGISMNQRCSSQSPLNQMILFGFML